MKAVDPDLAETLSENLTYLCRLWAITRVDGEVMRFTDHDKDITFGGEFYTSNNSFQATAVSNRINSAASDMDITVLLVDNQISYNDLKRGLYDSALTTVTMVNYKRLDLGGVPLAEGVLATIEFPNRFVATLRITGGVGKTERLLTEKYSTSCRAKFGDDRCKVDLDDYTEAFTVDTSPHGQEFAASELTGEPNNRYARGFVTWLTGANTGTKTEVVTNIGGSVRLFIKTPYPIQPGDDGTITRGCPKTLSACQGYANVPNYRGEPYIKALE